MNGGDQIVAVVVTNENQDGVTGDIPIFLAKNEMERQQLATALSRLTKSMVHELPTGVILLVRH